MEYIKILTQQEKKKIENQLHAQFGIKNVGGKILMLGAEKLFFFTGEIKEDQIKILEQVIPVDKIGVYFAKLINEEIKFEKAGRLIK